jgi:hypothetical protein
VLLRRYRPPRKDEPAVLYERFIRKVSVRPRTGETPQDYAARVAAANAAPADEVNAITERYLAARYGSPDGRSLAALQKAVQIFKRRTQIAD